MSSTFAERYSSLLKDIFIQQAQQQLQEGADGMSRAEAYAERGKPEFALAYLLLSDAPDELKSTVLARSYEQRAAFSEEKAADFDRQFRRPFPLIKLQAQKDRLAAQQVRQGRRLRPEGSKNFPIA